MQKSNVFQVLLPSKITLLSNDYIYKQAFEDVLLPSKITLLSNTCSNMRNELNVLLPSKITLLSNYRAKEVQN